MSKNTLKRSTENATSSTITTMDNNIPQIKRFDPSVLIGKVIYELDSNNIITWQLFMRGILQYYDLEEWVDIDHTPKVPIVNGTESINDLIAPYEYKMKYGESVTKEDLKTDASLKSLIRSTLGPKTQQDIQDPSLTGYQIWQTLQQIHIGDDVTRRNQLIDETNALRYNPKTSFSRFLTKLSKNINMIEYMNVVVTDEEKKLLLFNSLPEEYQSVNIFDQKDWKSCKEYTLGLVERLKKVEERKKGKMIGIQHVFSTTTQSQGKGKGVNQDFRRYPKRNYEKGNGEGRKTNSNVECFFCHRFGHFERDCKIKRKMSQEFAKKQGRQGKQKTGQYDNNRNRQ